MLRFISYLAPLIVAVLTHTVFAADNQQNHLFKLKRLTGRPDTDSSTRLSKRSLPLGFLRSLGADYAISVLINNQPYDLVIDAGSYYTWLVVDGFRCHDTSNPAIYYPPWYCGYTVPLIIDPKTQVLSNSVFETGYVDGSGAAGFNALINFSLNGLNVVQHVGLVDNVTRAAVPGASGVLGLSLPPPTLPEVFPNVSSAIVDNLVSQNRTGALFQIAIARRDDPTSPDGGLLNFGPWPTSLGNRLAHVTPDGPSATVPLRPNTQFYNITLDSIFVDGKRLSTSMTPDQNKHYIIDTGTLLNYLPYAVAAQLNQRLGPSVVEKNGTWFVNCKQAASKHGVQSRKVGFEIGGKIFHLDAADLVYEIADGTCATSFQSLEHGYENGGQGSGFYILGQQFLKNVLVEIDWGRGMAGFRARKY